MKAPSPPEPGRRLHEEELTRVLAEECVICGGPPLRWSYYCKRCRRFVLWQHHDYRAHAKAMKEAWNEAEDGFVCMYTGVRLRDDDQSDPWFLTFDHGTPGDRGTIVVAAYWVNLMKNALSTDEFWKVARELDACWREKREFDRNIVPFDHWRRKRRRMAVRR